MDNLKPLLIQKLNDLKKLCKDNGFEITFICGYRSPEEQTKLYNQGRTTPGNIVTQAKAGQSLHNYGVAFDVCVNKNGLDWNMKYPDLWKKMGSLGESIGLEWGGNWDSFKDNPHFQITFGHTWQDFRDGKVDMSKYEIESKEDLMLKVSLLQKLVELYTALFKLKK